MFAGQAHSSASAASVVLPGCSAHRVGCRAIPVANDHVIHPSTVNSNLESVSWGAKAPLFQVPRHSCVGSCPKIWTIEDYCFVCHETVPQNILTVPGRCQSWNRSLLFHRSLGSQIGELKYGALWQSACTRHPYLEVVRASPQTSSRAWGLHGRTALFFKKSRSRS